MDTMSDDDPSFEGSDDRFVKDAWREWLTLTDDVKVPTYPPFSLSPLSKHLLTDLQEGNEVQLKGK